MPAIIFQPLRNWLIQKSNMKITSILMIPILLALISCAKIEHLTSSLLSDKEKQAEAGYGEDPASMIAFETAVRNSIEPFIDAETIYENVYFGPNSAELDETAKAVLWKKILWLEENPDTVVVIQGHSDYVGPETDNLIMGERRAESVQAFWVELGVDPERLITVSYGEERLADWGKSPESHAKNRRVSFAIR